MVAPTSRYAAVGTCIYENRERKIAYLRRRFIPPPAPGALLTIHTLAAGERLDLLAARYFGDPELFWMLCDANGVMHPDELAGPDGRRLAVALPE
jgi:hypothetical protein